MVNMLLLRSRKETSALVSLGILFTELGSHLSCPVGQKQPVGQLTVDRMLDVRVRRIQREKLACPILVLLLYPVPVCSAMYMEVTIMCGIRHSWQTGAKH